MKELKKVTTLNYKGNEYFICHDGEFYWAMRTEWFTNGKLNREVNGIMGHIKTDLNDCIESVKMTIDFQELIGKGLSHRQAWEIILNQ